MCGGGGSPPPPAPVEPAPTVTDPDVQEAIRKERELARRRTSRQNTILTGPSGLIGDSPAQKKTLLGG